MYVRIKINQNYKRELCDQEKSVTMLSRNMFSTQGTAPFLDVPPPSTTGKSRFIGISKALTRNPMIGQISFKIGTTTILHISLCA